MSVSTKGTSSSNQFPARKEQVIANSVENVAPGSTAKDSDATTAELKDNSKTGQIDSKKERENPYDSEGSDDESDSECDVEAEEDAPPAWFGYGSRAKPNRPVAGPKDPVKPVKGNRDEN
ncbi:hypothetical protein HYPSUDRAFT_44826 [Hypholoma sublateritium FD-334 SS-4]|uniref:Uncharacterized protein n=1 Tax=Hypholoma sublateritium (strain FD-334 SS-4) TaxID=945553 RepID=A0A0D2KVY5_HYPSF|nr:hypothetical protein HYPSUDRAFT_44826 [Hypholoma sublateritium FD-334 SS-4]